MFTKTDIESKFDAEIISALEELRTTTKTAEEYGTLVDRIAKLHKLKTEENENSVNGIVKMHEMKPESRFKPVSLDTVLVVAANIFGILWLARYEKEHVIHSRSALGFVMKPRQ